VRVVPNARRAGDYAPGPKAPIVLSAGRLWDEAKNVQAVAEAVAGLPWTAYVAGDTTAPAGAAGAWGDATRDGSVHWLGTLPPGELAGWMARAAVYALPARYEPFGLSVLEAGLSACALVLGDVPSLREVWGDAALFVAPDVPAQLACALRTLAADAEYRAELGARARARALGYTPARMAAGYLDAYAAAGRAAGIVAAGAAA
jgi:glycosyltransferase involved in cell wall biosynthesis